MISLKSIKLMQGRKKGRLQPQVTSNETRFPGDIKDCCCVFLRYLLSVFLVIVLGSIWSFCGFLEALH